MPEGRSPKGVLNQLGDTATAALKGYQNAIFFGQDDKLIALTQTALGQGRGNNALERLANNLALQQIRSAQQAKAHPIATSVGANAGIGTTLAVGAPLAIGRTVVSSGLKTAAHTRPRITSTPRLSVKPVEYATTAGAAGVTNAAVELTGSKISQRQATSGDIAGATAGGAAGALATFAAGPRVGAAVEAAMTPIVQDLLNGESPSAARVRDRMILASIAANKAELQSMRKVHSLTSKQKGNLGEALSVAKTLARLELPAALGKRIDLKGGGYTVADHVTKAGRLVEAKFGEHARLTRQQRRAQKQYGPDNYRHDRWRAEDVGKISGYGAGAAGSHLSDEAGHEHSNPGLSPLLFPPRPKTPPRF